MEQRPGGPLRDRAVDDTPHVIPSPRREADPPPRREADPSLMDDETDGDVAVPAAAIVAAEAGLTERELAILAFEKRAWRHAGAKEQAIRDQLDISATRYYQLLNGLLDNPAALVHDPVLVGRLRRLRGSRSRARGSR